MKFNFKEGGDAEQGNVEVSYTILPSGKISTNRMGQVEFWHSYLEMSDNQRVFPSCRGKEY